MKITISKLNTKIVIKNYNISASANMLFSPYDPDADAIILNIDGEDFAAILYKNCYMFKCPKSLSGVRLPLTKSLSILLTDC